MASQSQSARPKSSPHSLSLQRRAGGAEAVVRHFGLLVGEAPAMRRLYRAIERVAASDANVFLTGESGVGKDLVARAIHAASGAGGAFVAGNCGGFPGTLLASELFGHERGAFTGAVARRAGLFERARGGTLFLDEIGEMPLDQQPSLLRALDSRVLVRLGGAAPVPLACRVIAATNCSERQLVRERRLREDLYYRLAVVPLRVPALRERPEDLPLLVNGFLEHLNREHGTNLHVDAATMATLGAYDWPGNVRELRHAIHHAYVLSDPAGSTLELPADFRSPFAREREEEGAPLLGRSLDEVERQLILGTLQRCANNKPRAAAVLGVSIKTLYNKLKGWNLNPEWPVEQALAAGDATAP